MNKLFIFLFYFLFSQYSFSQEIKSIEIIANEMEWDKQKNIAIALFIVFPEDKKYRNH